MHYWCVGVIALSLFGLPAVIHAGGEHAEERHEKLYTCPRHPGVKSEKPGKCAKCGMALKEMKRTKIIYACPMHPDAVSDKPARCAKCGMNLKKIEIVASLHELMEEQEEVYDALPKAIAKKDFGKVASELRELRSLAEQIKYHKPPKNAKKVAEFRKLANDLISAIKNLEESAEKNVGASRQALESVGASCSACHKIFRAEHEHH